MTTRRAMANPAGKRVGVEVGTPVSGFVVPVPVPLAMECGTVVAGFLSHIHWLLRTRQQVGAELSPSLLT